MVEECILFVYFKVLLFIIIIFFCTKSLKAKQQQNLGDPSVFFFFLGILH